MSTATKSETPELTFREIMDKSAKSAFRGGISGAAAMGANVACLMWMRTTVRCVPARKKTFAGNSKDRRAFVLLIGRRLSYPLTFSY